jgi:hypothetical protein
VTVTQARSKRRAEAVDPDEHSSEEAQRHEVMDVGDLQVLDVPALCLSGEDAAGERS